jgi:hypothetical protein
MIEYTSLRTGIVLAMSKASEDQKPVLKLMLECKDYLDEGGK